MRKLWVSTIAVAVGLLLGAAQSVRSAAMQTDVQQQSAQDHGAHHPDDVAAPEQQGTAARPASSQNMMAEMKARHAKLDTLVAQMNAATGTAKVDAMAVLLTTLVQEHEGMCNAAMMKMHDGMMQMHQTTKPPAGGK